MSALGVVAGDAASFLSSWLVLVALGAGTAGVGQALLLTAATAIGMMAAAGLYPGYRIHPHEILRRRTLATAGSAAAACAAALAFSGWRDALVLLAFVALALALQPVLQGVVHHLLRRAGAWGEPVEIVAEPHVADAIAAYLEANWTLGLRPRPTNRSPASVALVAGSIPSPETVDRLRRMYDDLIVVADVPGLRTPFRPADVGGEVGVRIRLNASGIGAEDRIARGLDIAIAAVALALASPILAAAAIGIFVADPGAVLYRQIREGRGGRPFRILKLRTMYDDADARLEALLRTDPAAKAEWEAHFKLRDDPRILPVVGSILRRTSIDELPQLWNVLAGDMRIVGPRPFPDYHLAAMDAAFRKQRCSIHPGLTGLWQISERSNAGLQRQEELDLYYIENHSFWMDLHIILKTVPAALRGTGAY